MAVWLGTLWLPRLLVCELRRMQVSLSQWRMAGFSGLVWRAQVLELS